MLEITNLHATIGGKEILKDIDLSVPSGEAQKLVSISLEGSVG